MALGHVLLERIIARLRRNSIAVGLYGFNMERNTMVSGDGNKAELSIRLFGSLCVEVDGESIPALISRRGVRGTSADRVSEPQNPGD